MHAPPAYLREVANTGTTKDANTELIRRPINEFNWARVFANTSVNEKVNIFNNTILNIISNFIPHEILNCDGKGPPWFNN